MERHIFLVGMPGSGKSALGRRVAQKLQIPYLDTDVYLTEATGMNTAQLYTTFGEQAFRDGETRLLQQLVNAAPGIISTGGGVLRPAAVVCGSGGNDLAQRAGAGSHCPADRQRAYAVQPHLHSGVAAADPADGASGLPPCAGSPAQSPE